MGTANKKTITGAAENSIATFSNEPGINNVHIYINTNEIILPNSNSKSFTAGC